MLKNVTKATPAKWGNVAASIIGLSMVLETYEEKLNSEAFFYVSLGFKILSMGLIVFTGTQNPQL